MNRHEHEPTADYWPSYASEVVYAPSVPLADRKEPPYGQRGRRRFRERWGDRALLVEDLRCWRPYDRTELLGSVSEACNQVWKTAQPLAGLLDLAEISHRLEQERWACCQLLAQLDRLLRERYKTDAAEKVLIDQFTERLADLEGWAEEHRKLYEEHGANPTSVSRSAAEALVTAEALANDRPSRDTAEVVGELRRLLRVQPEGEV